MTDAVPRRRGGPVNCSFAEYDATYVFGALDSADRDAYQSHLGHCADCRAAVQELSAMPALLARRRPEPESSERERYDREPVPDTLLPRLLERVRAERRTLRRRMTVLAAVVAVAAVVGGVLLDSQRDATGTADSSAVTLSAEPGVAYAASVVLTERAWGTAVETRCKYDGPTGERQYAGAKVSYALYAIDEEDHTESQVATWYPQIGREMDVPGSTKLARSDIDLLEIRTETGKILLSGRP